MKRLSCLLFGHQWLAWELVQYLFYKRTGKITGLYNRWCQRCGASQFKTVVTTKEKPTAEQGANK